MNEEQLRMLLFGILLGAFLIFCINRFSQPTYIDETKVIEWHIPNKLKNELPQYNFYIQPLTHEIESKVQVAC